MPSEVRVVRDDDDFAAAARAVGTAFLDRPSDEVVAWRRSFSDVDRVLVAVEDGAVCGTARSFPTPLTVPGGETVPMGAVSAVGVLPTHRRRGHLTRLMHRQLDDIAALGEPVAGLVAAEWPIYGRYGYGMAIPAATYEVDSRLARFVDDAWHGTVELIDTPGLRELAPPVFDRHRVATPGAIGRDNEWWDGQYGDRQRPGSKDEPSRFRVVHRDDKGTVDGYCVYGSKQNWDRSIPSGRLEVSELITTTPGAYADLWRFLFEVDWTSSVKASPRPVDEHLPFMLTDGRAVQETHRGDHIWLRLLDVPAVLEMRRYRCTDSLVIETIDTLLGRGGRFALEAGPDGAQCVAKDASPDLTLSIAELGAACMGGTSVSTLARAGLLDEHTAGAVARADALFSWSPAPFCSTNF
jgi:predicted acetyltransferase